MTTRARRFLLAAVAVSGSLLTTIAVPDAVGNAAPACLARVTSQGDDPVCVGTSNGQPVNVGTPGGVYGPNGTNGGVSSGPLLPGQSWNGPIH